MQCRRCGIEIHSGLEVCPHCGARQRRQPSHIHCAHCGQRALSALTLCPHCGRRLRARRVPVGVGSILIALVILGPVVVFANGSFAQGWQSARSFGQTRVALVQERLNDVGGKVLDAASSLAESELAEATPTPTLVVVLPELPTEAALLASLPITVPPQGGLIVAPTTVPEAAALAALQATNPITASEQATTTEALADASAPTLESATATQSPTVRPTVAPPTPTAAQPAPPTATPATPTATPVPTLTATAAVVAVAAGGTGGELTYTVQPGDNWFTIARRFGITQEALAAFNGSTSNSILKVGQRLRIPTGTVAAPPTPTPAPTRPKPMATPVSTTAAQPDGGAILIPALSAPTNLRPLNYDGFSGADSQPLLRWDPVPGVSSDDFYYVRVQFLLSSGEQGFVDGEVTDTRFVVPRWVFDAASLPDRLSYWTVQVRRRLPSGQVIELSPPSEISVFYWR